ncbi:MAG: phosphate ABC transporter permease subunit PstC [Bacillota bacterium]
MSDKYRKHNAEFIIQLILMSLALTAVLSIILIIAFIWKEGWSIIAKVGIFNYIFGQSWQPYLGQFGVLPLIAGSLYVTFGALAWAVPFGLGCAVFLVYLSPKFMTRILQPAISMLAGIPSVVYGFFGLVVIRCYIAGIFHNTGLTLLTGAIVLGIMILPNIISVSVDALRALPREYMEGSLAMGATLWQTIYKVLIPAARNGLTAAVILGMGRALGETMAVLMVTGNRPMMPGSILDAGGTLTGSIGQDMSYASGDHRVALFANGILLFLFIALLNSLVLFLSRSKGAKG